MEGELGEAGSCPTSSPQPELWAPLLPLLQPSLWCPMNPPCAPKTLWMGEGREVLNTGVSIRGGVLGHM